MAGPKKTIVPIPVKSLDLDRKNPRLPAEMDSTPPADVIRYYWDNYVLEEIIESFKTNGYFLHEPLIVMQKGKRYTTLEGNRRLAALIQMLWLPGSVKDLTGLPGKELKEDFSSIPCLVVKNRKEVAAYLGFRHIGGIKPWPPEAKARFVATQIRFAAKDKTVTNPFAYVGSKVGTNAQGVRLSYFAFELLHKAREEFGINTAFVTRKRFGVWLRCMSSQGVLRKFGVGIPRAFKDFEQTLCKVKRKWLNNVVDDLSPGKSGEAPILVDSRNATVYGYILENEMAYKTLRQSRDLQIAEQMVSQAILAAKIDRVTTRVKALISEAEYSEVDDEDALESAKLLYRNSRTLVNTLSP